LLYNSFVFVICVHNKMILIMQRIVK
jgi:hypothetical protein